jgi:protein SCO1/2
VLITGILGWLYFYDVKQKKRDKELHIGLNIPHIFPNKTEDVKKPPNKIYTDVPLGGSFTLVDSNGKVVTDEDFKGKWMFVYFGFSYCPDICPTEMHKMQDALNSMDQTVRETAKIVPIFITIDPHRDSCQRIDEYLKSEKLEEFVGLTGTVEQLKAIAKKYRVYYAAPDTSKADYNIDHSIFMYLMDTEGKLYEYFAKNQSATDISQRLNDILSGKDQ